VNQDSEGPSLEAIGLAQMRKLLPDRQQGVLQHVLGETGISEDPPCDPQERVTYLVHQICESVLIAGAGSLHHISIQLTLRDVVIRPPSINDEGGERRNRSVQLQSRFQPRGAVIPEFLHEIDAERTAANPDFPRLLAAARERRTTLRVRGRCPSR
jgi:hypothetical protein